MRDKNDQGEKPTAQQLTPKSQSRRDFLEGAGAAAVVTAAVPALGVSAVQAAEAPGTSNAPKTTIQLTVNGSPHSVEVEDR